MAENYCSNCSEALKEFAVVCNGCGKPVSGPSKSEQTNAKKQTKEKTADYCSNCGEALKEFAVVCNGCGKPAFGIEQIRTDKCKKTNEKNSRSFCNHSCNYSCNYSCNFRIVNHLTAEMVLLLGQSEIRKIT
jgi:hypothetical protein